MAVLVCACGATSSSSATALPGQGKPTIVLGGNGSTEQVLLGELYAQALRAQGYVVVLEPNLGDTEQINNAFQRAQIDAYPEDLGELTATVAGQTAPTSSESETEQIASQYESAQGASVMPATPFSDAGAAVLLASLAKQRDLTSIEQLKALPFRLKFGGPVGDESQYSGFTGVESAYGVTNLEYVSLAAGLSIYDALDSHLVQVGTGQVTDPLLGAGTYAILSDPKGIFGFHHVALIIRTSLLSRLGPQFQRTYAAMTDLLTLSAMRSLKTAVELNGEMPAAAAHSFLLANHLLTA
jgi:osmoprotectant transport system substrate-binding protein